MVTVSDEALSGKRKAGKLQGYQFLDHAISDADLTKNTNEDSPPTPHACRTLQPRHGNLGRRELRWTAALTAQHRL